MASIDDVVTKLSGVSSQLGDLVNAIAKIFPQGTGVSGTATAGAAALPPNPVGFVNVTLPDGTQAKVPYYSP